ncbi:uncharacterized protein LOC122261486 [Penaeus japonicus]|uniref:uncharacterized protein LOC122261486 n=1 Tax=Penaeus japonicus TaxID=27405 RepID=UPI001C70DED8|nr:uncharacterized protein LOC122261486 [Penaeus japonicus]
MKAYHIYVNLCWMLAVSIAFSRGDADAPNPVVHNLECSGNERHSCSQGNVISMDWLSRGCLCDDLGGEYGDYCYDVDNNAVLGPTYEAGKYRCVPVLPDEGQYMTASCPSDWEDEETAASCRAASPEWMSFQEDPLLHIPVTSRTSNVTYANYHCAVCHSDTQDIDVWNIDLECPSLGGDNDVSINEKRSDLVFQEGQWGVLVNGSEQDVFHRCQLTLAVVNLLIFSGRSCRPIQDKCMENWDDETIEKLCHSNTSLVYVDGQWYKNSFCATCNNASNSYVICDPKFYSPNEVIYADPGYGVRFGFSHPPQAFTVLIDFSCRSGSNKVGERSTLQAQKVMPQSLPLAMERVLTRQSQRQVCTMVNETVVVVL